MNTSQTIQTVFEIIIIAATLWGLFNDEKIADFEQKIFTKWRARK